MQIVRTDKGYISGPLIGEPGKEVSIFRGIPYAATPVRDLRWKPPQPVVPWDTGHDLLSYSDQSNYIASGTTTGCKSPWFSI
jgi:carboxylesterase type B